MPTAWQRIFRTSAIANVLPAGAAETVVAQLQINDTSPDALIDLQALCKITTGATTASIVPRIRRAGVAGQLVSDQVALNIIGAVGETHEYGVVAVDQPGEVASLLYVLTIVQTGATAAGTLVSTLLRAILP